MTVLYLGTRAVETGARRDAVLALRIGALDAGGGADGHPFSPPRVWCGATGEDAAARLQEDASLCILSCPLTRRHQIARPPVAETGAALAPPPLRPIEHTGCSRVHFRRKI